MLQGTWDLCGQAGRLYDWEFQNGDLAEDRSRDGYCKIYREVGWRKVWMFKEVRWAEEEMGTEHEEERKKGRVSSQWFSRCWGIVRRLVALFVEMFILASETVWTFARVLILMSWKYFLFDHQVSWGHTAFCGCLGTLLLAELKDSTFASMHYCLGLHLSQGIYRGLTHRELNWSSSKEGSQTVLPHLLSPWSYWLRKVIVGVYNAHSLIITYMYVCVYQSVMT